MVDNIVLLQVPLSPQTGNHKFYCNSLFEFLAVNRFPNCHKSMYQQYRAVYKSRIVWLLEKTLRPNSWNFYRMF